MNDHGTLKFTYSSEFSIVDASHRVKLLLGLYHSTLPLNSEFDDTYWRVDAKSVPLTCYGNVLYLRSKISSVVGFSNNDSVSYISLCYHIYEILIPNVPIITRVPGSYFPISNQSLTNQEFELV